MIDFLAFCFELFVNKQPDALALCHCLINRLVNLPIKYFRLRRYKEHVVATV